MLLGLLGICIGLSVLYLDIFVILGVNYSGLFWIGAGTLFIIIIIATIGIKDSPIKLGFVEPEPYPQ